MDKREARKAFGQYVRDRRLESNQSLRKFCNKYLIDPQRWSKMERGDMPPPENWEFISFLRFALMLNCDQENKLRELWNNIHEEDKNGE